MENEDESAPGIFQHEEDEDGPDTQYDNDDGHGSQSDTDNVSDSDSDNDNDSSSDGHGGSSSQAGNGKPPSKRHFEGNRNYVSFFNGQVASFFSLEYAPPVALRPSKVAVSGAVYLDETDSLDHVPGTYWKSTEKETFFRALARFSIHRLDEVVARLPTKSPAEILSYYHLLKREMGLRAKTKVRFETTVDGRRHFHKMWRQQWATPYDEIPIAYEVNEDVLAVEEIQAQHIYHRELVLQLDGVRGLAKPFKDYVDDGDSLINYENAWELGQLLSKNRVLDENHPPRYVPGLHFQSMVMFEELAKLVTRRYIIKLLEMKTNKLMTRMVAGVPDGVAISAGDIKHITQELGLFETPRMGVFSANNDGKCGQMKYYWAGLSHSLNFRLFKSESQRPVLLDNYAELMPPYQASDEFLRHPQGEAIVRASEVPRAVEDVMEENLFVEETRAVDASDMAKSLQHQHGLLTMWTTYNETEVEASMFSEAQVMDALVEGHLEIERGEESEVERSEPPGVYEPETPLVNERNEPATPTPLYERSEPGTRSSKPGTRSGEPETPPGERGVQNSRLLACYMRQYAIYDRD